MPNRKIILEVLTELEWGNQRFGPHHSIHEAIAVLREEYLELEQECFHGTPDRARAEAIQCAAMAVKLVEYLDGKEMQDIPGKEEP